jgi:hypothetical protein
MDNIRAQLKNPYVMGGLGLFVGTLFGLVVLGWWLWPVQWTDASPADLTASAQEEYLRSSIEAFGYTGDAVTAKERYDSLGEGKEEAMDAVMANPAGLPPELINAYRLAILSAGTAPVGTLPPPSSVGTQPPTTAIAPVVTAEPEEERSLTSTLLPVLCVIVLLLAAGVVVWFILRSRKTAATRAPTPAEQAQQAAKQATYTDYSATAGAEPPIGQYMASYKLGDDLFDDSFSVDSSTGEFLGECGVGISETIGVGDPKKVTAFEVWLFDKNDIQTVTKVLMSTHAYSDTTTRQRLAAKGEPVLVEAGIETILETQSLQLVARVVDMAYGEGALPNESFFDRFILELAVWPKG